MIARIVFFAMIGWHFMGHFSALLGRTDLWDFPIKPPFCWLIGCTSFLDSFSYNLFWSIYIAGTGVAGLFAIRAHCAAAR
jgi:hypothetical protein